MSSDVKLAEASEVEAGLPGITPVLPGFGLFPGGKMERKNWTSLVLILFLLTASAAADSSLSSSSSSSTSSSVASTSSSESSSSVSSSSSTSSVVSSSQMSSSSSSSSSSLPSAPHHSNSPGIEITHQGYLFWFCVLLLILSTYKPPALEERKYIFNVFCAIAWFTLGLTYLSAVCFIEPFSAASFRYCPDVRLFNYQTFLGFFYMIFGLGFMFMTIAEYFRSTQQDFNKKRIG